MEEIKIVTQKIEKNELEKIAENQFGNMVKAVVDVEKEIMALGGDLHADEEALLLENGSIQENLWGINIYLDREDFLEFDSMINVRPRQENRSRGVENVEIQEKIRKIVNNLVEL